MSVPAKEDMGDGGRRRGPDGMGCVVLSRAFACANTQQFISENVRKLFKKDENGKWTFAVKGGVIEMKDNKVIVLAD